MGEAAARRKDALKTSRRKAIRRHGRSQSLAGLLFLVLACLAANVAAQDLASLSEKIRSGNIEEKREALFQFRNLRSEAASRAALPALSDRSPIVRATAASSVIFLQKVEAAAAILPLLNDKDEFVRREAAFALGEVGESSAARALGKSLTSDKSQEVRAAAAAAVGKVGDPELVPTLVSVLDRPPREDTEVLRRAAARSIGQIAQIMRSGKVRVVTPQDFLPEKYKDRGPAPTPELLSHFASAVRTLVRILENSAEAADTRREAAFSLGSIGDRSAEAVLSKYTASPDTYLAEISREAILKLRPPE